ncbi:MAG: hypothetical protein ACRDPS_00680, partial [Nocardioides sp.]|uniref:hypothetical protein n=1 Tax=Nocardioides sp. TaxID=35761 RepID=UPI003D6B2B89
EAVGLGYLFVMAGFVLAMVGAPVAVLIVLMLLAATAGFLLAGLERRRARRIHRDLVGMRDERRRHRR